MYNILRLLIGVPDYSSSESSSVLDYRGEKMSNDISTDVQLLLLLLFPHISPISRTRGHRRRLPFPYHRYIQKNKQKKRKRGKNNRRESLPRSDRRGGEKIKQEQKKSKDPPSISERQINKQARQTKCENHTTVDTVRESLSTPHQSLGGGSGQSSVETKEHQYSNAKNHPLLFCGIQIDIMGAQTAK